MSTYGDEYGELLGGAITTIPEHGDEAVGRLPQPFKERANLIALLRLVADEVQNLENVLFDMIGLHDIDAAAAGLQDTIGAELDQPRYAFDDATYRTFLLAKASINARPFRRTIEGLLQTLRLLMGPDRSIDFFPQYPKGYTLVLEDLSLAEQEAFIPFLRLTKPATYNAQIVIADDDSFGFDDSTGAAVVTKLGFDNASAPPNFGGTYAYVLPIFQP